MPLKIKLINSKKNFLADYTRNQPIEPIIKECYRQFKIPIPEDFTETRFGYAFEDGSIRYFDVGDFTKKWGDYNIPKDAELIFEP